MSEAESHSIPKAKEPAYRRIATLLRNQILSGKIAPGDQLPSQGVLAGTYEASVFTIHAAIQALVKEGWVESIRGGGVYAAESKNRFVCAGIYHGADICSEKYTPFLRRVHVSLLDQFHRLKKETLVFIDTRPRKAQQRIMPALEEAIRSRRIQCLVFPEAHSINFPALNRLVLPTSTTDQFSPRRIDFDPESLLHGGIRNLAKQGCRSVGMISSVPETTLLGIARKPQSLFRKAARAEGLAVRDDWIRHPTHLLRYVEHENYGFTQFQEIWKMRSRPEGLIIYPDTMARGAILAILDIGRSLVAKRMKFIFHRNAHLSFLCPFPVTWAISNEDILAAGMIQQIQKQLDGEKTVPVLLPYQFKQGRS